MKGLVLAAFGVALVLVVLLARMPSPPKGGSAKQNQKDGLRYVWIPSGDFLEGCSKFDPDCSSDEKPAHDVSISKGFWMGRTEVTVGAYRRFSTATHRSMPPDPIFGGGSLNAGWTNTESPVVNVDWNESQAYCHWAGGNLPTEAQWEYAARSGNSTLRYGALSRIAWTGDNSGTSLLNSSLLMKQDPAGYLGRLSGNRNSFHSVGLLAPNQFGLSDMLGNVWEWTADWYSQDYYQLAERFDPTGKPNGETKVLRGASWTNVPNAVRASVRGHRSPLTRSTDTGFRCVL